MQKAAKEDPEEARANSRVIKSPASATLQISPLVIAATSAAGESAIHSCRAKSPSVSLATRLMQSGTPSSYLLNKPRPPPAASQGHVPPELSSRGAGHRDPKHGFTYHSELGEKQTNMHIFNLAVQLLLSRQNRCGVLSGFGIPEELGAAGLIQPHANSRPSLETRAVRGRPHVPGRASPLHWCRRSSPPRRDRPCSGTPRYRARTPYLLQPRSNRGLERKEESPPK